VRFKFYTDSWDCLTLGKVIDGGGRPVHWFILCPKVPECRHSTSRTLCPSEPRANVRRRRPDAPIRRPVGQRLRHWLLHQLRLNARFVGPTSVGQHRDRLLRPNAVSGVTLCWKGTEDFEYSNSTGEPKRVWKP
jgi:hypothetical protein